MAAVSAKWAMEAMLTSSNAAYYKCFTATASVQQRLTTKSKSGRVTRGSKVEEKKERKWKDEEIKLLITLYEDRPYLREVALRKECGLLSNPKLN